MISADEGSVFRSVPEVRVPPAEEGSPKRRACSSIAGCFKAPCTIEILGCRKVGKSVLAAELVNENVHLKPVLVVTRGPLPALEKGATLYTCTRSADLVRALEKVLEEHVPQGTSLVAVDSLNTLIFGEEEKPREPRIQGIFRILNALEVRVLVVNSTLGTPRRTSDFYDNSILLKRASCFSSPG